MAEPSSSSSAPAAATGAPAGPDVAALADALRASVPEAMRALPQWLLWRLELYAGDVKPRKVPYWVSGRKRRGVQGGVDDRRELTGFEIALTHLVRGRYDGLGFAFLPGDGLIGIDIDGAIDAETGEVAERCQKIIEACASYTEYSPSGRGVHIIVAGETETFKDNSIGLEVFCGSQFFTVTGRRWPGAPEQVSALPEETLRRLQATVRQAKRPKAKPAASKPQPAPGTASDFERINSVALSLLDLWVPQLLPAAVKQGTGAWRVRSRDLGRDLQEDLSLHPSGISDFGEERGLTPIDVVVKFGGKRPADALRWLAGMVGMQLARPAAAKRSKAAAAAPAGEGTPTPTAASGGGGGDPPGEDPPPTGDDEPAREPHWRKQLLGEGGKKDCRENVFTYLVNHPKLKGLVAYNEFSHQVVKTREPPWDSPVGEWTTNDDYFLALWLAQNERITFKSESVLIAGVAMAAYAARFHPVVEYLDSLAAWDGVPRLRHWLPECLGTEESEYTALIGSWFIMGMVRRIRNPGCQHDYMIVLEGLQGKKKSTALRTLAVRDEWFADTPVRLGTADAMLTLAGKWVYEIAEMDSFNRAETTAVKGYITSRSDRVREPYARRFADRPRSGVLVGSTNQSEYFKDPTGARRFWPAACDGEIDLAKLVAWRDQLYAEAMVRLASEDAEERRCWPTRAEEEQYLVPQQEKREIVDPWFDRLALWLESTANYGDTGIEVREVERFTAFELLTKCLNVPMDRIDGNRQMSTRVGQIMHKLAWVRDREAKPPRVWFYKRPKARPPSSEQRGHAQQAGGGPPAGWTAEDFSSTGDGGGDARA